MNYYMIGFLYKLDVELVRVWEIFGVYVLLLLFGIELFKLLDFCFKFFLLVFCIIL